MHFIFEKSENPLQQSTHGAELNSEATLNCNGKEFKCINSTHYQPCSLTERSGQQPQWTINGVILPCAKEKSCDDESSFGCGNVARDAQPVIQPSQIPVEVTVVQKPVKVEVPVVAAVEEIAAPAKALPVEEPAVASVATLVTAAPVEQQRPAELVTGNVTAPSTEQGKIF